LFSHEKKSQTPSSKESPGKGAVFSFSKMSRTPSSKFPSNEKYGSLIFDGQGQINEEKRFIFPVKSELGSVSRISKIDQISDKLHETTLRSQETKFKLITVQKEKVALTKKMYLLEVELS
jgi:hypothetical protein